jgi:hypothetical protein
MNFFDRWGAELFYLLALLILLGSALALLPLTALFGGACHG